MTYQEFKQELFYNIMEQDEARGKLIRLLPKGYVSHDSRMNSVIRCINLSSSGREETVLLDDFIHVTWGEGSIVNMMQWNVRECYEKFRKEGWQGILPEILIKLQQADSAEDRPYFESGSYEQCRSRLILRPVNFDINRFELEGCIYWKFGDIALALYGIIQDCEEDYITMRINREMAERWRMQDDSLLTGALLNSYASMPPRLYYATDLRRRHDFREGSFMRDEPDPPIDIHMDNKLEGTLGYRLTTSKNLNGAIAIFYPGVQERVAELMGGDYYVGFTSIHEAVIHPVLYQAVSGIQESIRNINAVFPTEEMLTNKVYRYCKERRALLEI